MRQHRQGFMKCWNLPHRTVSPQKNPPCWMAKWKIAGCSGRWEIEKMEREGWPARRKKKIPSCLLRGKKRRQELGGGNRFPSNSQALFPAHQYPAITNVKVLSWVVMSQTCCQCPQESLLFELLQFTSKCIAQEKTNIYLIQIGMSHYIQ